MGRPPKSDGETLGPGEEDDLSHAIDEDALALDDAAGVDDDDTEEVGEDDDDASWVGEDDPLEDDDDGEDDGTDSFLDDGLFEEEDDDEEDEPPVPNERANDEDGVDDGE